MEITAYSKYQNLSESVNRLRINFISSKAFQIIFLLSVKLIFQLIILNSGYRWLSADDYCRTVKSYEWFQNPVIDSGVWLTPHFWINGAVMFFVKDLFTAALIVNVIFSSATVFYLYSLILKCFDKKNAFFSTLIFCFFPFQVWLSVSGLPESIFFFFVIAGIYYFVKWKFSGKKKYLSDLKLCIICFFKCFQIRRMAVQRSIDFACFNGYN